MTREEYIDFANALKNNYTIDFDKLPEFCDKAISALSADARENIHARWESDGHGHIICTACKEANVSTWKSRFCPMCGARMDEVKHDE